MLPSIGGSGTNGHMALLRIDRIELGKQPRTWWELEKALLSPAQPRYAEACTHAALSPLSKTHGTATDRYGGCPHRSLQPC